MWRASRTANQQELFRVVSSTLVDSRRITFEPESLLVEVRDVVGSYQPSQEVFWDEVRAVYTWSAPNWNLLVGWGVVILMIGLVAAAANQNTPGGLWTAAAVTLIALAILAFYAIRLAPQQWYQVASSQPDVIFGTQKRGTLEALLTHVTVKEGGSAPGAEVRPDASFAS